MTLVGALFDFLDIIGKIIFDNIVSNKSLLFEVSSKWSFHFNDIFFVMEPKASFDSASLSVYIVVTKPTGAISSLQRKGETHDIVDSLG